MIGKVLYVHGLSPLHPGVGQQAEDVDLPVAREVATGWPYVPGSTIKGVLRSAAEQRGISASQIEKAFGPPPDGEQMAAGELLITDARLLFLPVRCLYGTFAWVTCPLALQRLHRDRQVAGGDRRDDIALEEVEDGQVLTPRGTRLAKDGKVFLEDLDFAAASPSAIETLAEKLAAELFAPEDPWRRLFQERLAVVSDQVFTGYAALGTEVRARIRLEDTGTVASGALWYEEMLPSETVLQGLVLVEHRERAEEVFPLLDRVVETPLQLGGDASVGRGLAQLRLADGR